MRRTLLILTCIMVVTLPSISSAAPAREGGYMSFFIGSTIPTDADVSSSDAFTGLSFEDQVSFDPGINLGVTGGYDFGFLRLEGELSYKEADIDSVTDQAGFRFRGVDGDLGAFAMMANAFADLHNGSKVTPYFGGGIGFATLYLSDTYGTDTRGATSERVLLYPEDDDTVFAYQVGAGMEIALNRQLSLDVAYRYFGTSEATFDSDPDITTNLELESHNASIGLRFRF